MQAVQSVRPSGVFAKVNRVRFTQQGNKFGACDGDGSVAFWQASNATTPFFVIGNFRFFCTVWKYDFPITHILREINFGDSKSSKTTVFAFFEALNFINLVNFSHQKVQKFMKSK